MNKKFITVEGTRVQLIHYMPFDAKDGLHKTEQELLQMGFLVDAIPEPETIEGKVPELNYAGDTGFWYEYLDRPVEV